MNSTPSGSRQSGVNTPGFGGFVDLFLFGLCVAMILGITIWGWRLSMLSVLAVAAAVLLLRFLKYRQPHEAFIQGDKTFNVARRLIG
jgi:hypothetical protein